MMVGMPGHGLFRKRIAVPQEHGSWVFLLLPLLVGLVAGGRLLVESAYLAVAGVAVFFMRQPLLAMTKVRAGRRPQSDLPAAWTWLLVYATIAALHVYGLVLRGHAAVLWLGVPAALVAAWHAWLVFRRAERRQALMEVVAAGALALSAPAGVLVAHADPDPALLVSLWLGTWLASASMIACTVLRLEQRTWPLDGAPPTDRRAEAIALLLPAVGLVAAALAGRPSPWLALPFVILLAEAVHAWRRPARGARPRAIGMRQLAVSVLATLAFLPALRG